MHVGIGRHALSLLNSELRILGLGESVYQHSVLFFKVKLYVPRPTDCGASVYAQLVLRKKKSDHITPSTQLPPMVAS
jgi:hypothetical protein